MSAIKIISYVSTTWNPSPGLKPGNNHSNYLQHMYEGRVCLYVYVWWCRWGWRGLGPSLCQVEYGAISSGSGGRGPNIKIDQNGLKQILALEFVKFNDFF